MQLILDTCTSACSSYFLNDMYDKELKRPNILGKYSVI